MQDRGDHSDGSAPPTAGDARACAFVTTHWSLVGQLAASDPDRAAAALEQLCRAYWFPIYAFIRRTRGVNHHDAGDLTQGFFEHLLEHETLRKADREQGRFRSFLLGALRRFLANERDWRQRQKRGGRSTIIPLDEALAEDRFASLPTVPPAPEHFFDRQWAADLLRQVLERLRHTCTEEGKAELFRILEPALTRADTVGLYADCAARLGMEEGAVRAAMHRLRTKFHELLKSEVARTVAHPDDVDDELRHLIRALTP